MNENSAPGRASDAVPPALCAILALLTGLRVIFDLVEHGEMSWLSAAVFVIATAGLVLGIGRNRGA